MASCNSAKCSVHYSRSQWEQWDCLPINNRFSGFRMKSQRLCFQQEQELLFFLAFTWILIVSSKVCPSLSIHGTLNISSNFSPILVSTSSRPWPVDRIMRVNAGDWLRYVWFVIGDNLKTPSVSFRKTYCKITAVPEAIPHRAVSRYGPVSGDRGF